MTDPTGAPAGIDQLTELRANRAIEKCKNTFAGTVEALRARPAFAGCTEEDVVALLCAGKRTAIPAHWAFVQEGTPADAAYLILEGNARVFRDGVPVADVAPGDVVGETGLLNGTLRNATVTSLEPLRAIRLDQDRFAELLWRRPNVRSAFRHVAEQRRAAS